MDQATAGTEVLGSHKSQGADTASITLLSKLQLAIPSSFIFQVYQCKPLTNISRGKQIFEFILGGSIGAHFLEKVGKRVSGKGTTEQRKSRAFWKEAEIIKQ